MSNRPARFTQAELARAARVAKENGWRVEIVDGVIRLVEGLASAPSPDPPPLAKVREFRL